MPLSFMIAGILAPIMAGFTLASVEYRGWVAPWVSAAAVGASIATIYLSLEGVPPFPPVSSKHKLAYALAALPVLAILGRSQRPHHLSILFGLSAVGCFVWLIHRPLAVGRFEWHWVLPAATILVFSAALLRDPSRTLSPFAWPVTALSISVTASFIALFGGFLGLGQVFLSLSAMLGGYAFALFWAAWRAPSVRQSAALTVWTIQGCLLILLIQLSTFATNLSKLAYVVLLGLMCLPLADPKLSRLPVVAQPFAFAAAALLAGVPAIFLAIRNF